MISGVDSTALGSTDAGSERSERVPACSKHAWCVREHGHADRCLVRWRRPAVPVAPADFGPGRQQLAGRAVLALDEQRDSAPADAESFATGQLRASGAAPVPAEANAGGAGASNGDGAAVECAHPNTESHWSGLRRCADCRADLTPAAEQGGAT